jgi:excinuclease ABC subunit B
MYADTITDSMRRAIDETNRRRKIQAEYNAQHNIVPQGIVKQVRDLTDRVRVAAEGKADYKPGAPLAIEKVDAIKLITELEKQMKDAAKNWEFEKAALLRDQIIELKQMLDAQDPRPEWEKVRETEAADYVRELKELKSQRVKRKA